MSPPLWPVASPPLPLSHRHVQVKVMTAGDHNLKLIHMDQVGNMYKKIIRTMDGVL